MTDDKKIFLLGFASGLGSGLPGTALGPVHLKESNTLNVLNIKHIHYNWINIITPPALVDDKLNTISSMCSKLSKTTEELVARGCFFGVLGGDHSCAIGTWSGAAAALHRPKGGAIGLIWIDAHMDSHTMESTHSGNIHGMPLAALLGHGVSELTDLVGFKPILRPEHVCLIGVRSFEPEEAALLKQLGVRVFLMEEVAQRGLPQVMAEAKKIVSGGTKKYGISVDIDSMDPFDAPGTGVREPNGLHANELTAALGIFAGDPKFMGFEIAEFDPSLDIDGKTQRIIPELMAAMTAGF